MANETTTSTSIVVVPVIQILGGRTVVKGVLVVTLACSKAACTGLFRVYEIVHVVLRHGTHTVRRTSRVLVGSARYRLAAGTRAGVRISLDSRAWRALQVAKRHRLAVTLRATVAGGRTVARPAVLVAARRR